MVLGSTSVPEPLKVALGVRDDRMGCKYMGVVWDLFINAMSVSGLCAYVLRAGNVEASVAGMRAGPTERNGLQELKPRLHAADVLDNRTNSATCTRLHKFAVPSCGWRGWPL